MDTIIVGNSSVTIEDCVNVAKNMHKVDISSEAIIRINNARKIV